MHLGRVYRGSRRRSWDPEAPSAGSKGIRNKGPHKLKQSHLGANKDGAVLIAQTRSLSGVKRREGGYKRAEMCDIENFSGEYLFVPCFVFFDRTLRAFGLVVLQEELRLKHKREYDMLIEETAQRAYGGVSSCQVPSCQRCLTHSVNAS